MYVDVNEATVEIVYADKAESVVLAAIPQIVRRIGYGAALWRY